MDSEHYIISSIERAGRVCYKSNVADASKGEAFISNLIKRGHLSVIEHASATVLAIWDRGVSHEIVRQRLMSVSQESTRYCNYSKDRFDSEITVIRPFFFEEGTAPYNEWRTAMHAAESAYLNLLDQGATAQEARTVLPNSLKTEMYLTANMREWRHIFNLRCSPQAHPQMRQVMIPLLQEFYERIPVLFEDIWSKYKVPKVELCAV